MSERRLTNSERRLRRLASEEPEQEPRGVFELFGQDEPEQPDQDAPLARADDGDTAA